MVALIGRSGCGKSTRAQVAVDLIKPREERVARGFARHAMEVKASRRMRSARAQDNISLAVRLARLPHRSGAAWVAEAGAMDECEPEDRAKDPVELSRVTGQRVAVVQTLAPAPDFIFFDELFTALDVALKRVSKIGSSRRRRPRALLPYSSRKTLTRPHASPISSYARCAGHGPFVGRHAASAKPCQDLSCVRP